MCQIRKEQNKFNLFNTPSDSSILSHSSRMKCLTFLRDKSLSLDNARILPGVPTTI